MPAQPILSIIVPFFNEQATIVQLMEKLEKAVDTAEVIYVDDGSVDASLSLVKEHLRTQDKVLSKSNGGKGSAVREGLKYATGEYTVIQDADLEYDPSDLSKMLECAREKKCDAVLGSRRVRRHVRSFSRWRYYIGGVLTTWFYNILYAQHLTDMNTCYKMVKTDLLRSFPLREQGFGLDAEIVAFLARHRHSILEVSITYNPRSREEGKKIGWKDFFVILLVLLRLRFAYSVH